MKKLIMNVAALMGTMIVSTLAFGQDGGGASSAGLMAIGAGLAIGIGAFGAATGQGRAAGTALEGIARNPGARDQVFQPFILSLVFMEFQALLSFVIAILWTLK